MVVSMQLPLPLPCFAHRGGKAMNDERNRTSLGTCEMAAETATFPPHS